MFLFEGKSPKGKNREGGPERNFRQEIDVGRIPPSPYKFENPLLAGVYFGQNVRYFFYLYCNKEIRKGVIVLWICDTDHGREIMNKTIFTLLTATFLAACATTTQRWTGANFDDFIIHYGNPTAQYPLQNGNTSYSFKKPCAYTQGQEEKTVIVGVDNTIQQITVQSYCPVQDSYEYYDSNLADQINYLTTEAKKQEDAREKA